MVDFNDEEFFQEDFEVPSDSQNKGVPQRQASEAGFYTAELSSEDPITDSQGIALDIEMSGTNAKYEEALARWKDVQELTTRDAVVNIISDPSIPTNGKTAVARDFHAGKFTSSNLKDQYVQEKASSDITPLGNEDIGVTGPDRESQELFLNKVETNLNVADDVQAMITSYAKNRNNDTATAVAGFYAEALSPLDLHSIRSALTANDLGINVKNKDIFGDDDQRLGVPTNPENPDLLDTIFNGVVDIAETILSPLDSAIFDVPRNFLFTGSLNKKISDVYQASTPEQQQIILRKVLESIEDVPGTDFQQGFLFDEIIEGSIQGAGAQQITDVFSILSAGGAAAFFRNPVKGVQWYTTYTGTGLPSFAKADISFKELDSGEIPTKVENVVLPEEIPTGSGQINALDDTMISSESLVDNIPFAPVDPVTDELLSKGGVTVTEMKLDASKKVFDQSKELADKGNKVVHVDSVKFDSSLYAKEDKSVNADRFFELKDRLEEMPEGGVIRLANRLNIEFSRNIDDFDIDDLTDQVATKLAVRRQQKADKAFKDADKEFVRSSKVDVQEVKVDKDGTISFPKGDISYRVLRENGLREIPLSMDIKSVINAQKAGLISRIDPKETILDIPSMTRMLRPSVNPSSPAGVVHNINPVEAYNRYVDIVLDNTDDTAKHFGTTKGEAIMDSALPKLDISLDETFPNINQRLAKIDEEFNRAIKDGEASILDKKGTIQREIDTGLYVKTLKEQTVGTYNNANSTVHIGRNKAEGIATFGRNEQYGWNTLEEAQEAIEQMKEINPNASYRPVERQGTHWVEQEWSVDFNHIDRWQFGLHSMDSKTLGIPTNALSREKIGKWWFPTTMKGDPDLAGAGFLAELKANSNEAKFFGLIRKEILDTPHRKQLAKAMNITQEEQRFLTLGDLRDMNPELTKSELGSLAKSYFSYKRGSDYAYELANKLHRSQLEDKGFQGVYDGSGELLAYGKVVEDSTIKRVWDYNTGKPVNAEASPEGKLIELSNKITIGDSVYTHAILSGPIELKALPARTMPKIDGWVPRKNQENWYIDVVPTKLNINGVSETDPQVLQRFKKTVGAGKTRKEAEKFAAQLASEHQNGNLVVREAAENAGDAGLEDYVMYSDTIRSAKKRGDRLRTINGFTTLEDPLQAFAEAGRSLTKLNAWQPLRDSFEKSFMNAFSDFIPKKNGLQNFPNTIDDLNIGDGASPERIKKFKVAQRLLEQFKEMQYTQTAGDRVWRSVFNSIANTIEDVKWAGPELADLARRVAKEGNFPIRMTKSMASHLFIYLNPPRQWYVQPQQLLELNAISPSYAKNAPTQIPSIIAGIMSRAPHLKEAEGFDKVAYNAAKKASLMKGDEFDATVDAIYNVGLPQAVDLNQMLYGGWGSARFDIDPSTARKTAEFGANLVKAPGRIGKNIGYTPAEMANNIGTWLYARNRWQNNNPNQNWNTPENVARITADAWDINHSMIGRAGAMPFQNGALGVLFQFMAVQQKGFMQLLSSKTLTPLEKVKLAAARLVLYGGYGVPMGAIGLSYLDQYVAENASDEFISSYENMKGGMVDALGNTTLDVMFADPGTEWEIVGDSFVGKREGRSDISISKAMTPIPDSVPLYDMIKELSNFTDNDKRNPRFPGPAALGSLAEAVNDVKRLWQLETLDTPEKLKLASLGVAETASLFNNVGKAIVMKNFRDKASKMGQEYGLDVTDAEIFAQKLGLTTREEELIWATIDINKEKEAYIKQVSDEVFRQFMKMERIVGEQEYDDAVSSLNNLMALAVEHEDDVLEVRSQVESKIEKALKAGTIKRSLYEGIFDVRKNVNDEKTKQMIGNIRRMAASNPGDKQVVEMMENAGLLEKE